MLYGIIFIIAIILFLIFNKLFNFIYIGFGAIWKVFFVCLIVSGGIVSGVMSLFDNEKEPSIEEILDSAQTYIEEEIVALDSIQKELDENNLSQSIDEVYQEFKQRSSSVMVCYVQTVGSPKINLDKKKIAKKVNQIEELYRSYEEKYNQLIYSLENKEESEREEVDLILGQMYSNLSKVNQKLSVELTNYLERTIRKDDLIDFVKSYEPHFTEVSTYESKLNENMSILSNYEKCVTAVEEYNELIEQLQSYIEEDEVERDLDSLSTAAAIKVRTFLEGVNYERPEVREEVVNQSREEIDIINEIKGNITDEVLVEAVNLYLDFLTQMAAIDAETFYIYDAEQRQYIVDRFYEAKRLVEMYEELSRNEYSDGRQEITATYNYNPFLSNY